MRLPRSRSAGQHARSEAEFAGIGNANCVRLVIRDNDRGDWSEHFFVVRGLPRQHVGEHRRRIPGTRTIRDFAAQQKPSALAHALGHLTVDLVPRLDALHRAELCAFLGRIAHLKGPHRVDHRLLEGLQNRTDDDEALARDAALAAVDHPRGRRDLGRGGNIRVLEDQVGIGTAKLEHAFL